jgi:hypothetical protein
MKNKIMTKEIEYRGRRVRIEIKLFVQLQGQSEPFHKLNLTDNKEYCLEYYSIANDAYLLDLLQREIADFKKYLDRNLDKTENKTDLELELEKQGFLME